MNGTPNIARIGALVGDPARAGMLGALMDGRALSAGELAREVGINGADRELAPREARARWAAQAAKAGQAPLLRARG